MARLGHFQPLFLQLKQEAKTWSSPNNNQVPAWTLPDHKYSAATIQNLT